MTQARQYQEGLDNLIEAFTVIALQDARFHGDNGASITTAVFECLQDAVHPTPLFELLGIALEEMGNVCCSAQARVQAAH